MTEFVRFGSPDAFELAVRWSPDREPRQRLPQEHGWSTGEVRITVGHIVLTRHEFHDADREHLSWYLSPIMAWLIDQWSWLFHEEAFSLP